MLNRRNAWNSLFFHIILEFDEKKKKKQNEQIATANGNRSRLHQFNIKIQAEE